MQSVPITLYPLLLPNNHTSQVYPTQMPLHLCQVPPPDCSPWPRSRTPSRSCLIYPCPFRFSSQYVPNIPTSLSPNIILGLNPPPGSVGAIYTGTFDFPPIYPPRVDLPSPMSDSSTDYTTRYRVSAHNIVPSMRDSGSMIARPGMYPLQPPNSWPSWEQGPVQDSQDMPFSSFDHKSGGAVLVFTPISSLLTDLPLQRWFWPQPLHSVLPLGYPSTSSSIARLQWKRQQYFPLRDFLRLVDLCSFVVRPPATQPSRGCPYDSPWVFPSILGNYPLLVVERLAHSTTRCEGHRSIPSCIRSKPTTHPGGTTTFALPPHRPHRLPLPCPSLFPSSSLSLNHRPAPKAASPPPLVSCHSRMPKSSLASPQTAHPSSPMPPSAWTSTPIPTRPRCQCRWTKGRVDICRILSTNNPPVSIRRVVTHTCSGRRLSNHSRRRRVNGTKMWTRGSSETFGGTTCILR